MTRSNGSALGYAALIASVVACERGAELEPAATAFEARGLDDAVMSTQKGVEIVAQADEWPGEAKITAAVTPLRVVVENGSTTPVQIRYSSFKLTAADGTTYHAIPPRRVTGVAPSEIAPVQPRFQASGFRTAPYFSAYYPGITPYSGVFAYDGGYYETYYRYWETTELPTPEMLAMALPEGVVDPSGRLDGYLYFEQLKQDEGTPITFQVELNDAQEERPFISLEMPFVVD